MAHEFCRPLKKLILNIPPHILTTFRYGPLGRPEHTGLQHLWRNQSRLTNLQLDFSLNDPSISELIREDASLILSMKSVSEVEVNFGVQAMDSLDQYDILIDLLRFPKLKKVTLTAPEVGAHLLGPLLMDRFLDGILPRALTHLSLSYISLPNGNGLRLDDYVSLKQLELHECSPLDTILGWYHSPALVSLVVQSGKTQISEPSELTVLSRFLLRFGSLERLIIDADVTREEIEGLRAPIANHAGTLKSLFVISSDVDDFSNYPLLDIPFCCEYLSQLVVPAGNELVQEQCEKLIKALPQLVTLNIIALCPTREGPPFRPIAEKIFRTIRPESKLSLLVFGEEYQYGDRLQRYSHFKGDSRSCYFFDRTLDLVISMEVDQVKYVVSECDLLDYRLAGGPE
ncbi:MAG: hypothetical protein Q9218_006203 [Villophora microphyllina]